MIFSDQRAPNAHLKTSILNLSTARIRSRTEQSNLISGLVHDYMTGSTVAGDKSASRILSVLWSRMNAIILVVMALGKQEEK